ncbi:uncharacterized protein [Chelonus insularis]|uniref:uncharacterized protein n=1 Tax=Chelonus insularis TaxID=460826 RepID=UPI00158D7D86|nr:uncharacterized protein LOC118074636 [Chelonus insularis]
MFTSLAHDREDLRPVAKLHYLKANVSGPPLQLIRHAVMNDDGYEPAWNQLKSRYDDPEQLIFAHIKDLFSVTTPSSKSAEQLDNLVGVVRQNLDALKALNVPVDSANYFLVYLVASKLKQPLRESWELERSRSRSPTTLDSLLKFISTRARAMESAQDAARQAKRWPTPVITRKSRSQHQSTRQQTLNRRRLEPPGMGLKNDKQITRVINAAVWITIWLTANHSQDSRNKTDTSWSSQHGCA